MKSVFVVCRLACIASVANALIVTYEDNWKKTLRSSAQERVDITARSMFVLESLMQLPKGEKIPQAQQDHFIHTIEEQIEKVQSSMGKIADNERQDSELEHQSTLLGTHTDMKKTTVARLDSMRKFRHRLNSRSRVGAQDFVSKMKNMIHFIKKGALSGDADSAKGMNDALLRMGQMLGQPAPNLMPNGAAPKPASVSDVKTPPKTQNQVTTGAQPVKR